MRRPREICDSPLLSHIKQKGGSVQVCIFPDKWYTRDAWQQGGGLCYVKKQDVLAT